MKPTQTKRLLELDALRGIAAFGVVIYHYTNGYEWFFGHPNLESYHLLDSYIKLYFPLGLYAVQLFFIISGFVILNSLENSKRGTDFVFNRFSRLYPPYWTAICLTILSALILGFPPFRDNPPLQTFLGNLTMIHSVFKIQDIDPVYWTLKIELLFYIIMFAFRQLKLLRWMDYGILSWITILILEKRSLILSKLSSVFAWTNPTTETLKASSAISFPAFPDGSSSLAMIQSTHFFSIFDGANNFVSIAKDFIKNDLILLSGSSFGEPRTQAHLFIIGLVLYQLYKHGGSWLRYISLAICCLLQTLIPFPNDSLVNTPILILMVVLFLGVMKGYLKFLTFKPLIYLGTISYSLYLTHQMIGYWLMSRIYSLIENPYINIILTTCFALGLATLFTTYVERPSLMFLRNWYKQRNT